MTKVNNPRQLTINWNDAYVTDMANYLLDELNAQRKPKDRYVPYGTIQIKDRVIISAINRDGDVVHNVVCTNGELPKGESICWRTASHILHEFGFKLT